MKNYLSIMSKRTKLKCIGVVLLALISSMLASIWPVKLGELYTDITDGSISTITQGFGVIVEFGIIYFLTECITIIRRVSIDCIIASHEAEIREYSIEKLLKMPVSYYSGCLSGEKTAQLNQGVAGFSQFIKIICNDVVATVLTVICTLIQVLINAPGVLLGVMFMYLAVTVSVSVLQIRSQNGIRESIIHEKNRLDGQICQSISNLELIRGMSAEKYEKNRLRPDIQKIKNTEKKHHGCMGTFDCVKQLCKVVFNVVLLLLSIFLISQNKMTGGTVIAVCLLFQQLVKPVEEVYRFMDETVAAVLKSKALIDVIKSPSDELFDITDSELTISSSDICIDNVVVTNPEKSIQLAWYDRIVVPGGKITALQGPNGCGKSSLVRSINRYYPHTQGTIELFGIDQNKLDQKKLTDMIYYSPQTSLFIAGTIRENLIYGIERHVEDEELVKALQGVHLVGQDHRDSVISINPSEALSFVIGENANELSGGMKQRLSLARAFLRRPKLFVFDEITANLDSNATNYVLSSIESYAKKIGAGILYISHDQTVMERCENVIMLNNKLRHNVDNKNVA